MTVPSRSCRSNQAQNVLSRWWQRIREEHSKEEPLPLIHSGTRVADPDSTMLGIVVEAPGASTVCYGQTIAGAELLLLLF